MSKRQINTTIIFIFTAFIGAITGNLSYFKMKKDTSQKLLKKVNYLITCTFVTGYHTL